MILILCATGTAMLTVLAIDYGRRRGLIDAPGQRRSHRAPTPRGGGAAPVATLLVVISALGLRGTLAAWDAVALGTALFAVAVIGWVDDHRPLGPGQRLAVHAGAALLAVGMLLPDAAPWVWPLAALAVMVAINLCNFMDGINGLAVSQAGLVAALLGVMLGFVDPAMATLAFGMAVACLGFLPFNFPRARIFLGDVGSGALGLMVGLLGLLAWREGAAGLAALALLPSAFLIDGGLTLAARARARKNLARAHREHLYQWLVRSGASHAAVTTAYAGWTLAMGAFFLLRPQGEWSLVAGLYLAGGLLWWQGRRRVLTRRRRRALR
nr:glycosyl transferase family 4 [Lysobacter sp. CAU 1642]